MNYHSKINIINSLGIVHGSIFVACILTLLILLVIAIRSIQYRESLAILSITLGIGIYFHSTIIEHSSLARMYSVKTYVGGEDPVALDLGYAKAHTKIYAFQFLSLVGVTVGGLLLAHARFTQTANKAGVDKR